MGTDSNEHKQADNRRGCRGCLLTLLIIPAAMVLFILIYDRITINRYKKDPTGAHKEIVEGYATFKE